VFVCAVGYRCNHAHSTHCHWHCQLPAIKHAFVANVPTCSYWERPPLPLQSPRSSHQPRPQPVIQISSALATSEWNTKAEIGFRRRRRVALLGVGALIGLVRPASAHSLSRVLPCYMTAAAARGRPGQRHAQHPVPAARSHPSFGRRGASKATAERAARIVCLPKRDGRDADLSCVPNEKRPLSAVDARYLVGIQRSARPSPSQACFCCCLHRGWSVVTIGLSVNRCSNSNQFVSVALIGAA